MRECVGGEDGEVVEHTDLQEAGRMGAGLGEEAPVSPGLERPCPRREPWERGMIGNVNIVKLGPANKTPGSACGVCQREWGCWNG